MNRAERHTGTRGHSSKAEVSWVSAHDMEHCVSAGNVPPPWFLRTRSQQGQFWTDRILFKVETVGSIINYFKK